MYMYAKSVHEMSSQILFGKNLFRNSNGIEQKYVGNVYCQFRSTNVMWGKFKTLNIQKAFDVVHSY